MFGKKQQVHIHKHEAQHVTHEANIEIRDTSGYVTDKKKKQAKEACRAKDKRK